MRSFSLTLLLIFLPLLVNAAPVDQAEKLLAAGKFRQARIELLRMLDEDSTEVRVHYLLARTYDALGQFDYALRALDRCGTLTRDSGWSRKVRMLRERIKTEARRKVLNEGYRQSTATESRVLSRARHGRLLEMQREYAAAMREYQSLQKIYPGSRVGWFLAGRLKLAEGRRDDAVADMRKVFELAPDDTSAVNLLTDYGFSPSEIESFGFQGEFDYDRIERFAAERLYRRGLQLHHRNNRDTANVLERATELNPEHLKARTLLLEELYRTGDLDGAFDEAGEILRLDTKNNRAREIRYLILHRWGYQKDSIRELKEGLKQDTDAVALRLYLGLDLKNRRKQKLAAYTELARVIELDPENRDAADALQEMGIRQNHLRKLGYKGILLPVEFHPLDKVFVPGKRSTAPKNEARPPSPPRANQFEKKGRYARRQRHELPDTSEVLLGTGEVHLGTGEVLLGTDETTLTSEVYVDPAVELEDLLDLASVLPDSDLRAQIREKTIRRLFEQLDEDGRKAYARKLEYEIENSSTDAVTLRDVQNQRLLNNSQAPVNSGQSSAPQELQLLNDGPLPVTDNPTAELSTQLVQPAVPPVQPGTIQPPSGPTPPAAHTSPQGQISRPNQGQRGGNRPWWKFWNKGKNQQPRGTQEVLLPRQSSPSANPSRDTRYGVRPTAPSQVYPGANGRRRWTRNTTGPVSLTIPPVVPPAPTRPVVTQTPEKTVPIPPVPSTPGTPTQVKVPSVPSTPVNDAVRPATPNAWWHWGTNHPAPPSVAPPPQSTVTPPVPVEPEPANTHREDKTPAPVDSAPIPVINQPEAAAPGDVR